MNSEQEKFLNEDGLRILWNQISMQDYPNNTALTSIINTINTNKADKADIPNIDTTLSKSGAAADAKITGEAINNLKDLTQTQANWEQNDETAVDFIKNRTHYKTQINFTIIENTTVEFNRISEGDGRWTGTAEIKLEQQIPAPIAENNIITAIINGVEWTAPVEYNSDKDIMHAWIYYGMGGTLDIRFQQRNEKYPMLNYITIIHDGETPFDYNNFILSLYMSGASVIQIPLEYIPVDQSLNHPISRQKATEMVDEVRDDIPRSYYDLNDIPCYVKESESIFLSDVYFSDNNRLKIIEDNWRMSQYTTFEINGQLYPRKQYHTDQYGEMRYYYCGNGALIDNTGIAELEDTGEDFVIYANAEFKGCTAYYNGEIDGGYGFSINGVIPEEVKELDERCIPDTIARVSEIPESSNVYIGEQEPIDENIELWLDPTVETIQPIYPPATATIGQTIVVKAVDENGVPIEWEAVDLASGGGSVSALDWEYINTLSFVKDDGVASLYCSETADGNPFEYDEILIMNPSSDYGGNANIWCNRETMYFTDCAQIKSFLAFGNKKYCLLKTLIYTDGAQWILAESSSNAPVLYNISSAEKREDGKITSVCVAKSNTSDNAQATLQFYGRNYK